MGRAWTILFWELICTFMIIFILCTCNTITIIILCILHVLVKLYYYDAIHCAGCQRENFGVMLPMQPASARVVTLCIGRYVELVWVNYGVNTGAGSVLSKVYSQTNYSIWVWGRACAQWIYNIHGEETSYYFNNYVHIRNQILSFVTHTMEEYDVYWLYSVEEGQFTAPESIILLLL